MARTRVVERHAAHRHDVVQTGKGAGHSTRFAGVRYRLLRRSRAVLLLLSAGDGSEAARATDGPAIEASGQRATGRRGQRATSSGFWHEVVGRRNGFRRRKVVFGLRRDRPRPSPPTARRPSHTHTRIDEPQRFQPHSLRPPCATVGKRRGWQGCLARGLGRGAGALKRRSSERSAKRASSATRSARRASGRLAGQPGSGPAGGLLSLRLAAPRQKGFCPARRKHGQPETSSTPRTHATRVPAAGCGFFLLCACCCGDGWQQNHSTRDSTQNRVRT